MKEDRF